MADALPGEYSGGIGFGASTNKTKGSSKTNALNFIVGNTTQTGSNVSQSSAQNVEQIQYSDQALNQIITNILAGPNGVQDIGLSGKNTGLYNSTAVDLLLGNLVATAANQAAVARAPKVSTQTGQSSVVTLLEEVLNRSEARNETTNFSQSNKEAGGKVGIGTVICTALLANNLVTQSDHRVIKLSAASWSEATSIGYQWWGNKVADRIYAKNKFATELWLKIINQRVKIERAKHSVISYIMNPLGAVTYLILTPITYCIGRILLALENRSKLYG